MRGTGGNRFIGTDPTTADLMRSINDQLGDLREWAADTGRVFDLAEVTISTRRIPSGVVSVSVMADLGADPTLAPRPSAHTPQEGEECDGSECRALIHEHGCYGERQDGTDCTEPWDHDLPPRSSQDATDAEVRGE